ncbi:hypothetical protein [Ekhidna sp.]|uniref:hypothetical protein n=1 Tax=Ekhidna sp. TaxID=2608089 RepID=UPI003CCC18AE
MKKLSVLKVVSIIHLLLTVTWTIWYYGELNDGKGWGLLFSLGLASFGIIGLIVSWVVGYICKKTIQEQPLRIQNTIEAAFVVGFLVFVGLYY